MQVSCGRGSVLWRRCATLCTSGFINDVTFGRSGPYGDTWLAAFRYRTAVRSLMSMNALLKLHTLLLIANALQLVSNYKKLLCLGEWACFKLALVHCVQNCITFVLVAVVDILRVSPSVTLEFKDFSKTFITQPCTFREIFHIQYTATLRAVIFTLQQNHYLYLSRVAEYSTQSISKHKILPD